MADVPAEGFCLLLINGCQATGSSSVLFRDIHHPPARYRNDAGLEEKLADLQRFSLQIILFSRMSGMLPCAAKTAQKT